MESICKKCKAVFRTYPSRILSGKGLFCSKKCFDLYQVGKKPWNTGKKCPSIAMSKQGEKNPMWKGGYNKKEADKKYQKTDRGKRIHALANKKYLATQRGKETLRKWQKKRLQTDIHYKIKRIISNAIWCKLVRYRGCKKNGKVLDKLPYSIDELIKNIEKLLKPGMTWENYGEWHIDHKIPDSSFKYTSMDDMEFKKSWAIENLQPLWAEENLSKADKVDDLDK